MRIGEDFGLLESLLVELDPLTDGFAVVLVEVHHRGGRYVLIEVAPSPAIGSSASPGRIREPVCVAWIGGSATFLDEVVVLRACFVELR
jgi:hypothetical protein